MMQEPKRYKHTMKTLLTEWINREGGYLHQKLSILHNRPFTDPDDAEMLCSALSNPRADELDDDDIQLFRDFLNPAWYTIAWKMSLPGATDVREVIRTKGLGEIRRRLDIALDGTDNWTFRPDEFQPEWRCLNGRSHHFLFLISQLAQHNDPMANQYMKLAASHVRFIDGGDVLRCLSSWPTVFSCFLSPRARALELLDLLRDPLPTGRFAEGYLEFSNVLMRDLTGEIMHPFDTTEGIHRMQQIADRDDGDTDDTPAVSVVDALSYLKHDGVELLIAKLVKHKNKHVRSAARKVL